VTRKSSKTRQVLVAVGIMAIIAGLLAWRLTRKNPPIGTAYAGEAKVTLWSSTAQVREPVDTVTFGEPVNIMEKSGDNVKVQVTRGKQVTEGWVAAHDLIDDKLWVAEQDLTKRAEGMEAQGDAHTKAQANLRTDPGRDAPRFYQLEHDVPVVVLRRQVLDVPPPPGQAAPQASAKEPEGAKEKGKEPNEKGPRTTTEKETGVVSANNEVLTAPPKKEDWLLVLAKTKDTGSLTEVAGWVLARFVDLDLPDPLPSYVSSAGMKPVGWMVLNRVADKDTFKPQYLVFGAKTGNAEGNNCDFNTFRVFTWDTKRQRYETAYVESGFCGQLPVHCESATKPGGDANFHFSVTDETGKAQRRHYHLHQTKVHRMGGEPKKSAG
jgi:hypothetical protein